MDYKELKNLMDRYLAGESSVEEEGRLREYFLNRTDIPEEFRYAQAMFGHFSSTEKQRFSDSPKRPVNRRIVRVLSVAAGIALLAGILLLLKYDLRSRGSEQEENSKMIVIYNDSGIMKVELTPHTAIWLNKDTELRYQEKLDAEEPNILEINGEVYVEMDAEEVCKFELLVDNAAILNENPASFNVKSRDKGSSVELVVSSGAIKVQDRSSSEGLALLITAGNYCSVHKTQKLVFAAANKNPNYLAWKTGELVFENAYMATVTDVLEEHFNVKVEIEDQALAYCEFSGSFDTKSIDNVLQQIHADLKVEIMTTGNTITLSGSGCKPKSVKI